MSATAFRCEPPTDNQLRLLADLCMERGIEPLPVVGSYDDASACISAILDRSYEDRKRRWVYDFKWGGVPF